MCRPSFARLVLFVWSVDRCPNPNPINQDRHRVFPLLYTSYGPAAPPPSKYSLVELPKLIKHHGPLAAAAASSALLASSSARAFSARSMCLHWDACAGMCVNEWSVGQLNQPHDVYTEAQTNTYRISNLSKPLARACASACRGLRRSVLTLYCPSIWRTTSCESPSAQRSCRCELVLVLVCVEMKQ